MDKTIGRRILAIALGVSVIAGSAFAGGGQGCQRQGGGGGQAKGCCGKCAPSGQGAGRGGGMAEDRDAIHFLLEHHAAIQRTVEDIDGGVLTRTTSEDPAIVDQLRTHVRSMDRRVAEGRGLRYWDPLFVEIFKHSSEIRMEMREIPGGVEMRETSENPEVVALIRKHARTVSEFVDSGFERARQPSALPSADPAPAEFQATD